MSNPIAYCMYIYSRLKTNVIEKDNWNSNDKTCLKRHMPYWAPVVPQLRSIAIVSNTQQQAVIVGKGQK